MNTTLEISGAKLTVPTEALELHDQQMQACTGAQILAAMGEVRRRVDRGDVVQVEAA